MTKLTKTVVRESGAYDRSNQIVVQLRPQAGTHQPTIELRLKNSREALAISVEGLWHELCRRKADQDRRDRLSQRRSA